MKNDLTPDALSQQKKPADEPDPGEQQQEFSLSEEEAQRAMDFFRQEQNLAVGAAFGLIAALLGAAVWAGITVATEYQIGFMAIGVGFLVGYAVRIGGKGIDQAFGIVGAVMSLVGCALGNLFTIAWFIAKDAGVAVLDILGQLDFSVAIELMSETFQAMDILFYALALYFGYKYAFRQFTVDDFNRALGRAM